MEAESKLRLNWVKKQIENRRLHLSLWQLFSHYRLLLIPLSVSSGFILAYFSPSANQRDLTGLILVFGTLTILYLLNQWKSLRINAVKMPVDDEHYINALTAASLICETPLEWLYDEHIMQKESSGKFRWNNYTRFIHLQDGVLYLRNGIKINDEKFKFPIIPDQKNIIVIIDCLQKEKDGKDSVHYAKSLISEREKQFWNESEWTLGRILKRIMVYFFGLVFLGGFVLMLSEEEYFGALLFTVPLIWVIVSARSDFEIIRLKRKARKK